MKKDGHRINTFIMQNHNIHRINSIYSCCFSSQACKAYTVYDLADEATTLLWLTVSALFTLSAASTFPSSLILYTSPSCIVLTHAHPFNSLLTTSHIHSYTSCLSSAYLSVLCDLPHTTSCTSLLVVVFTVFVLNIIFHPSLTSHFACL